MADDAGESWEPYWEDCKVRGSGGNPPAKS